MVKKDIVDMTCKGMTCKEYSFRSETINLNKTQEDLIDVKNI